MPLTWITHQGRKILLNDFSKQRDEEVMTRQIDEELRLLSAEPAKVLMLVDVTDAVLGADFMKKAKAMAPQAERFLGRQAVVGVDTLKAILLTGFNAVSRGLPLKPFPGRDAAMSWLAS